MTNEVYTNRVKLREKLVHFRKWKVKDKNKFIANKSNVHLAKEALVYDCLKDKKIALSEDEYKYLLILIREKSLQDRVTYNFDCDSCKESFVYEANLDKIMSTEFKKYGVLTAGDSSFVMSSIQNRKFYENAIQSTENLEEKYLIDFILHVNSYNDNDSLDFAGLNQIIDNLDVDIFEKIFKDWEAMRFKMLNVSEVKCPNCKATELYEFDDLPGFFPESWDV